MTDPLHKFFLQEVSLADASPTGRMYAIRMVGVVKRDFPNAEISVLRGYLHSWNERSGLPFTRKQIEALLDTPPLAKVKRPKKKDRPTEDSFAVSLFSD